mmetsp:Transcript_5246/g.15687  ORF Transcript_5246/g.15687 Transcript_5246/m.15687 type:complete len:312 (+) Transcript_5246:112-1047(+)
MAVQKVNKSLRSAAITLSLLCINLSFSFLLVRTVFADWLPTNLESASMLSAANMRRFDVDACNPQMNSARERGNKKFFGSLHKDELVQILLKIGKKGAVVDVGAAAGELLTLPALRSGRKVYSYEPDVRNWRNIEKSVEWEQLSAKKLKLFKRAAGNENTERRMQFFSERSDVSCFNCMLVNDERVFEKKIGVSAVDDDVEEPVHLFKSSTMGFEGHVLEGSTDLFDDVGVRFSIVEIDPTLLQMQHRVNVATIVDFFLSRKYRCYDLEWRGSTGPNAFSQLITRESVDDFVGQLRMYGATTDLFCMKCID